MYSDSPSVLDVPLALAFLVTSQSDIPKFEDIA